MYFFLLGKYLGVGLLGQRVGMFIFIRNGQTVFQGGLTVSVKNSVNSSVKFQTKKALNFGVLNFCS